MLSHTDIINELAAVAPLVHISTTWEEDPTFIWDGDALDPGADGNLAHDVTVTAMRIERGAMREAESHLGGSYSQYRGPHCADIHGYFPQMAEEALDELGEATAAEHVRQLMRIDYDHP
jgi:hypothetical protein